MALVFYCPNCGAQNLVSEERLQHRERKVRCWVCKEPFDWTFIDGLVESQGHRTDLREKKGNP